MNDYNSSHVLHMKCMAVVLFTRFFCILGCKGAKTPINTGLVPCSGGCQGCYKGDSFFSVECRVESVELLDETNSDVTCWQ